MSGVLPARAERLGAGTGTVTARIRGATDCLQYCTAVVASGHGRGVAVGARTTARARTARSCGRRCRCTARTSRRGWAGRRRRSPASRPAGSASRPTTSSGCSRCTTSPTAHATFLRRLAPSARPKGWWDAYADTLSAGYANLIRLEAGSRALRCYGALVPHALLQSPDFVRQVILSTWETPSQVEIDRRIQVCRRRQDVLDASSPDGPLQFRAVLDESVLRRTAAAPGQDGGAAVLRGQLEWLAAAADAARTSRSRCCRSPRACRRSPPAPSPSSSRARPEHRTSSTSRTRPGSSSSTRRPRCSATAARSTCSAAWPSTRTSPSPSSRTMAADL